MFSFRNPFKDPMSVSIVLRSEESDESTFKLLMRQSERVAMAPFSTLQIPVSFNPTTISEKRATVEVRAALRQSVDGRQRPREPSL